MQSEITLHTQLTTRFFLDFQKVPSSTVTVSKLCFSLIFMDVVGVVLHPDQPNPIAPRHPEKKKLVVSQTPTRPHACSRRGRLGIWANGCFGKEAAPTPARSRASPPPPPWTSTSRRAGDWPSGHILPSRTPAPCDPRYQGINPIAPRCSDDLRPSMPVPSRVRAFSASLGLFRDVQNWRGGGAFVVRRSKFMIRSPFCSSIKARIWLLFCAFQLL